LGEIREINHINMTQTESPEYYLPKLNNTYKPKYTTYNTSLQIYHDRATGVPVEEAGRGYLVTNEGCVTNKTMRFKIVDTNIWGAHATPEFSIIAYVLTLTLGTATVPIVYLRQRKKQQTNAES
jgi:hypothetical protein